MFLEFIERTELADLSGHGVCWRDPQKNVAWTWLGIVGLNGFFLASTLVLPCSPFVLLPPRLLYFQGPGGFCILSPVLTGDSENWSLGVTWYRLD